MDRSNLKAHGDNESQKESSGLFHVPVSLLRCVFTLHTKLKSKVSAILTSIECPNLEPRITFSVNFLSLSLYNP